MRYNRMVRGFSMPLVTVGRFAIAAAAALLQEALAG